jgi:serine protease Do
MKPRPSATSRWFPNDAQCYGFSEHMRKQPTAVDGQRTSVHFCALLRHRHSGVPRALLALILIVCTSLGAGRLTNAAGLDPQMLTQIEATTFEVVAAKPIADNLTYIKPLPLELLPFQERTDKYFSIGTAFSIGNNRYVTAAHVLGVGIDGLWGIPAIRDSNGHVYPIEQIEKFSLARDFAVFSVTGNPEPSSLKIDTKPDLNSVVYAVGNALGTGVVVRDGLYTSKTPEEQDGRWNWLRFSAAASPGNSGGPLLDKDGAIIGIVLRTSQNENLNYALPIDEVLQAPADRADIDNRASYQFDVLDTVQSGTFKATFSLPLSFSEFSATFTQLANAFSDSQLKALLGKEPDKVFPRGAGSSRLLHSASRLQYFPALITRKRDGEWEIYETKSARTALSANGYVLTGTFGRDLLFHLRTPDDILVASLYADPEGLIKLLLKAGFMQRPIGTEKIQVAGLGKPTEDSAHVDAWQRRWQVRVWPLPFANGMFVTLSLPVPDGYITIARYASANNWHDDVIDLEAATDFICAGYWGTLAQWKDFLKHTALLPATLKTVRIYYEYDHRFSFESKRVSFTFTQELQEIGPDSLLGVSFSYLNSNGKVGWDIDDIRVQRDDEDMGNWINIQRHIAPSEDLDSNFKASWDKMVHGAHPYDAIAYSEGDGTRISAMVLRPYGGTSMVPYSAFVGVMGNIPQGAMKAKLDLLLLGLHVTEP